MKYIAFSFDDARADTYYVAKPIMEKYGLIATVNVVSDFVLNPGNYYFEPVKNAMTKEQVLEWQKWGGEVACHGSTHVNTSEDVLKNIKELNQMGIDTEHIGFASPNSWMTVDSMVKSGIGDLKKQKLIKYVRSGIQVRREGFLFTLISVIEMLTHSTLLYYLLNRYCIFKYKSSPEIVLSVSVKDYTSIKQIMYLISKLQEDEAVVLMFHSILNKEDEGFGIGHYFWDADNFEKLCELLSRDNGIIVKKTRELLS